jgi:hypothetical protein
MEDVERTSIRTDTTLSPATVARFWEKVAVGGKTDCWLWNGAVSKNGYGSFGLEGRATSAHRVAYRLGNGVLPDGLMVRHKCDTPICVNPDHLEPGTHVDNMRDKKERGREPPPRDQAGEKNYNAKLTAADVELIREFIALGWTNKGMVKRFGVTHANISAIRRGKSWNKP